MMPDRDQPISAVMGVREARDAYLAENGFAIEGYDAKWTDASVFGVKFAVPNTRAHRRGIMLHDLHHVATGYGTDLVGEGEISAWEIAGGLRGLGAYVSTIVALGALMGVVLAPKRTLRAYRAGKKNLFRDRHYDALLDLSVGELRERLALPRDGITQGTQGLHAFAPSRSGR